MSTLSERLALLEVMRPEITRPDLARRIRVDPAALMDLFSGETTTFQPLAAVRIAAVYGVSLPWLVEGTGRMVESPGAAAAGYGAYEAGGEFPPDASAGHSRVQMARIVQLTPCSNWFYYLRGASTPDQVQRVAAWATFEDGTTTGMVPVGGNRERNLMPRLEPVGPDGFFQHLAELPMQLRPSSRDY